MEKFFTPNDADDQIEGFFKSSFTNHKASEMLVSNIMNYVRGTKILKSEMLGDSKFFLN